MILIIQKLNFHLFPFYKKLQFCHTNTGIGEYSAAIPLLTQEERFVWLVFPCHYSDTKSAASPCSLPRQAGLFPSPNKDTTPFFLNIFWQFSSFRQSSHSIKFCSFSFIPNATTTLTVELSSLRALGRFRGNLTLGQNCHVSLVLTWHEWSTAIFYFLDRQWPMTTLKERRQEIFIPLFVRVGE